MKKYAPSHIREFCYEDLTDTSYCKLKAEYQDNYTFVYKIKCTCGQTWLKVFNDNHPSVIAICSCCGKQIDVYDLKYYPSAVKLNEEIIRRQIRTKANEIFNVYAIFQYDDEFEYEEDVDFDENDITWGIIYICSSGEELQKILDDETS